MKLGPLSDLEKRTKMMSKTFDDEVMWTNYVIIIFTIYARLV